MVNENKIHNFFNHFEEMLRVIESNRRADCLSSTVLANANSLMLIDAVSRIVYSTGNRRFVKTLENYCGWPDAMRISLISLKDYAKRFILNHAGTLIDDIDREINSRFLDVSVSIANDPLLLELPGSIRKEFSDIRIQDKFSHASLLYGIRNDLVHEIKGRRAGLDDDRVDPYYFRGNYGFRLNHPEVFFRQLTCNCLVNVKRHCLDHDVDPYESFDYSIHPGVSKTPKKDVIK